MNLFSRIRTKNSTFQPDYRDHILYNGVTSFRATGELQGDMLEFIQIGQSNRKILFYPNLTIDQYIRYHDNYEIFRPKLHPDFTQYNIQKSGTMYYPTGRIFVHNSEKKWELMKQDDSTDIIYMALFFGSPKNEAQFIFGKKCLMN